MTNQVLPAFWQQQDNNIQTPYYFYDRETLEILFKTFQASFSASAIPVDLRYAVKANHNDEILKYFISQNIGFDIVSIYEYRRCKEIGQKADKVIFSGVGKSDLELTEAIKENIESLNCESESELLRIEKICNKLKMPANVSLRVNPDVDPITHPYISTGLHDHKFGLEFDQSYELYKKYKNHPFINLCGITMHIGSQITELRVYREANEKLLEFAQKILDLGIDINFLDLGGGLGIDYEDPHALPPFDKYAEIVNTCAQRWHEMGGKRIIVELGRALVAQCGALISTVVAIKKNKKKSFAIVDASMSELLRPSLYNAVHPIVSLNSEKKTQEVYDVVGPVCESSDTFAKNLSLPELKEGDKVAILCSGAYGYVMASQYNCRPLPQEIWNK